MNQIATVGAWIVGPSYVIMRINLIRSAGNGKSADMTDPFNIGEKYYEFRRKDQYHEIV
jgi:cytochrome c oxidase subunit 1